MKLSMGRECLQALISSAAHRFTSNSIQRRSEEGIVSPMMWCQGVGSAFGGMGVILPLSLAGAEVLAESEKLITSEDLSPVLAKGKGPSVLPSCHLAWVVDLLCAGHSLVF